MFVYAPDPDMNSFILNSTRKTILYQIYIQGFILLGERMLVALPFFGLWIVFVCVKVLRPSQPHGVISSDLESNEHTKICKTSWGIHLFSTD